MNGRFLIAITAVTTAAFAQQTPLPSVAPVAPVPPAPLAAPRDVSVDWEKMQAGLAKGQEALSKAQQELAKTQFRTGLGGDIAGIVNNAFDTFNYTGLSMFQGKVSTGRLDAEYENGTRALDDRRYDDAIRRFNAVIDGKSPRADGALYWKAYALNREGRKDDALAAIAVLRRDYAGSHWLNDAQALEVEIKQSAGQPVSPEQESNEDLKLMALNSLMSADPDRAIPLIEGILKGNSSPKIKDRALFVLTQNRSPRAQQILSDYAKGAGNPDLQVRAIRYIGMSGTPNVAQQLAGYYAASNDVAVKKQIIQTLMIAQGKDALVNVAKTEKDESLRSDAIRQLGAMRATDQLNQLYASETSTENRIEIVRSLFVAGASDKLLDLAKTEKDQKVRDEAIRSYARTRSATPEALASLYTMESDVSAKRSIVNGIFERGDAKLLIDLARKEADPGMKRFIVERLGNMRGNKEATDYMIELLK
jgi:hypothetical protein